MSEEKIAERWLSTQHECPYCGEVQDDDGEPFDKFTCIVCQKSYILGDC